MTLTFTDDALGEIVREAMKKKTGARGLRSILEDIMLDVMYDIPSMEGIEECVIEGDMVKNHRRPLLIDKKSASKKIA